MALVTELSRRRRIARREGGLTWTAVGIILSAATALLIAQLAGWL